MRVSELEALLATLDGDTVVLVNGCQLAYITKDGAMSWPMTASQRRCNDCGQGTVREMESVDVPPSISFSARSAGRADAAPKVDLYGRWSRAAKRLFA